MMRSVTGTVGLAATVHRLYELIDTHDFTAMLELFADDVTYRRPGYDPIVGRAELARFYFEERIIREGTHTPELVLVSGSDVAVHGRFQGVLKSGVPVDYHYAEFFTAGPDGRFVARETYFFTPLT
jgi:steroid Delta-isomerase